MKRFLLLALTAGLLSPIAAKSEPIPKISDFDASISYPYRLDFSCPKKITKDLNADGLMQIKKVSTYEKCWVDFHPEYMEIMGMQKIQKKDIVRYWFQTEGYVGQRFYFHFLYRDSEGKLLKFIPKREAGINGGRDYIRQKNHENWSVELYSNAHNFINNWMAQ